MFDRIKLRILFYAFVVLATFFSLAQIQQASANQSVIGTTVGTTTDTISRHAIPSSLIQLGEPNSYFSPFAFIVDKSARTMELWQLSDQNYIRVAVFPADMGKRDGDKRHLGDHRTPEGIYFLLNRLQGKNLDFNKYGSRAFVMDYPNFFDRQMGKTGSGIWLHAVPDETSLSRGSRGCVVVRDDVIQEITPYVKLRRTPILITNKISYQNQAERDQKARQLNQWLRSWREAWQNKDINGYIHHYSSSFQSMKMNKIQWKKYKQGLNEYYHELRIRLSAPVVYSYQDTTVIKVLQSYESDKHSDFGEKTLYLRMEENDFQIVGEEWKLIKSRRIQEKFYGTYDSTSVVNNQPTSRLKN